MAIVKQRQASPISQDERRHIRDLTGLIEQLSDPNPIARRWAARDMANYPDSVSALAGQLDRETNGTVREAILTTLMLIGNTDAVSALVRCLRSEDAALRNDAIEVMKNMPDAVSMIIRDLLRDPDPDVRIFAVNILESLRHPDVQKWLIEVISNDKDINVCSTAVDLLAEVGTEDALSALEALKGRFSEEPYIAFSVDVALKRIKDNG